MREDYNYKGGDKWEDEVREREMCKPRNSYVGKRQGSKGQFTTN